jgi:hypothetical protein
VTESSSDELALKRQQLEQVKRDIENNLEASRLEWSRAIREGHSYREEHTAFMSAYEARCSRLVRSGTSSVIRCGRRRLGHSLPLQKRRIQKLLDSGAGVE